MCKKQVLINRNGRWYDKATGKQFVGKACVRGQWYEYTKDGRKVPLRKPKPNLNVLIGNIWNAENPQHLGFRNGKYYPFVTANGNTDFGPGIDLGQQTSAFRQRAQQGFTPQQMNQEVKARVGQQLLKVDEELRRYTNAPDTVSPQIKAGLADLRWQVGSLGGYPNLLRSVATGNLKGIQEESKTYYRNGRTGKMTLDSGRHRRRLRDYFHYDLGGKTRFHLDTAPTLPPNVLVAPFAASMLIP